MQVDCMAVRQHELDDPKCVFSTGFLPDGEGKITTRIVVEIHGREWNGLTTRQEFKIVAEITRVGLQLRQHLLGCDQYGTVHVGLISTYSSSSEKIGVW